MYSPGDPATPARTHSAQQQLLPSHESILLGSSGLWSVLDKDNAALHAHFHLQVRTLLSCLPV